MSIKLFASGGSLEWMCDPAGVYDAATHRTYIGFETPYSTNSAKAQVGYFNHETGVFSQAADLFTYPRKDDHGQPSICIIPNGINARKLLAFICQADAPWYFRRTTKTIDDPTFDVTTDWGPLTTLGTCDTTEWGNCSLGVGWSYPRPLIRPDGAIWLFYRHDKSADVGTYTKAQCFISTNDGGDTWSAERVVFQSMGENAYAYQDMDANGRVDMFISPYFYPTPGYRRHVLHLYSDDGVTWRRTDGSTKALPYNNEDLLNTASEVHESDNSNGSWVVDAKCYSDGPRVLWVEHIPGTSASLWYAKLSGGVWVKTQIASHPLMMWNSGGYYEYPTSANLDPKNPNRLILPVGANAACNLEVWHSSDDGLTWSKQSDVSDRTGYSWFEARPEFVKDYHADLAFLWVRYRSYVSWDGRLASPSAWDGDLYAADSPVLHLISVQTPFIFDGTTISAQAPINTTTTADLTVYSESGGTIKFDGPDAACFSINGAATATIPAGTSTLTLAVTPNRQGTLTSRIGTP